jgi:hypothetical protein
MSSGEDEGVTYQKVPLIEKAYLLSVNQDGGGKVLIHRPGCWPVVAELIRPTETKEEYWRIFGADNFPKPVAVLPPVITPPIETTEAEKEVEEPEIKATERAPDQGVQGRLKALRISHL